MRVFPSTDVHPTYPVPVLRVRSGGPPAWRVADVLHRDDFPTVLVFVPVAREDRAVGVLAVMCGAGMLGDVSRAFANALRVLRRWSDSSTLTRCFWRGEFGVIVTRSFFGVPVNP